MYGLCVGALLNVLSSFAIILTGKRERAALLLLSFGCLVTLNVLKLFFLTMPWVGLQVVIAVIPYFLIILTYLLYMFITNDLRYIVSSRVSCHLLLFLSSITALSKKTQLSLMRQVLTCLVLTYMAIFKHAGVFHAKRNSCQNVWNHSKICQ